MILLYNCNNSISADNQNSFANIENFNAPFDRKGIFRLKATEGLDLEELELELIDAGAEDITQIEDEVIVTTAFADFGAMQKALEQRNMDVISSELQRIPHSYAELTEEQEEEVMKLVELFEEDDDVQNVFHNLP